MINMGGPGSGRKPEGRGYSRHAKTGVKRVREGQHVNLDAVKGKNTRSVKNRMYRGSNFRAGAGEKVTVVKTKPFTVKYKSGFSKIVSPPVKYSGSRYSKKKGK
jgi:hypothetical protein